MLLTFGIMSASENRVQQEATVTNYLCANVWNLGASHSIWIEKRAKRSASRLGVIFTAEWSRSQ